MTAERTTDGQAAVDHTVCGNISMSNCTVPMPNDTFQVVAKASGKGLRGKMPLRKSVPHPHMARGEFGGLTNGGTR